jgi:hypothetical protein
MPTRPPRSSVLPGLYGSQQTHIAGHILQNLRTLNAPPALISRFLRLSRADTGTLDLLLHVRLLVDAALYVLAVLTPGRHLEAPNPAPHHKTNAPD